jgi:hypothetical protein
VAQKGVHGGRAVRSRPGHRVVVDLDGSETGVRLRRAIDGVEGIVHAASMARLTG